MNLSEVEHAVEFLERQKEDWKKGWLPETAMAGEAKAESVNAQIAISHLTVAIMVLREKTGSLRQLK
jgi:hypothetical protein